MRIKTLWITREGSSDEPELLVAWDEFTYDSHPEGFDKECQERLGEIGSEVGERRFVDLDIDETALLKLFRTVSLSATIAPPEQ